MPTEARACGAGTSLPFLRFSSCRERKPATSQQRRDAPPRSPLPTATRPEVSSNDQTIYLECVFKCCVSGETYSPREIDMVIESLRLTPRDPHPTLIRLLREPLV